MGEHDVDDRVKMATARTTTTARTRAESEPNPFGGGPTRVADANSIKNLIEMSAVHNDDPNDRKTREVDPAQFRALLMQQAAAAPAVATSRPEPAPEPSEPTRSEDEVDAVSANHDAGPDAASPAAPSEVVEAAAEAVEDPEVDVRKPAPARPVLPTRGPSMRTLVIASIALLVIAVLVSAFAPA